MTNPNTLIIADTHIPFVHPHYLAFCKQVERAYRIKRVTHVGDIVDNHAISFHDHDPNGWSAGDELRAARKELRRWTRAFPHVMACVGNHDELGRRKAYAHGIPETYFKSFNAIYGMPATWRVRFEWRFGNWRLKHGTGSSGHDGAFKQAVSGRISTAQGHTHTAAGVKHHASSKDLIWGMQVGCGIDRKAYAFNYGRDFTDKPVLGCGVVLENGTLPLFVPMPM